jgi:2-polyprenyl-3-methyl-5-hydroxy-6-metoxy-1,4-benzoquinol methylase
LKGSKLTATVPEGLRALLPEPFELEPFELLKHSVQDDPDVDVFVNQARDFAVLYPQPNVDYFSYRPRHIKLKLTNYRKANEVIERRLSKVSRFFTEGQSILEIGAADGSFLQALREHISGLEIAALETDQATLDARDALSWLTSYASFGDVGSDKVFDVICAFHVIEHIVNPAEFLASCRSMLTPNGCVIIEVPSLDDPLLSTYDCTKYREFFFQCQHPFTYSFGSLRRLLEAHHFEVREEIPHQRYGIENHLKWLTAGAPGGSEIFRKLFERADPVYREELERGCKADTAIVVASAA